MPFVARLLVRIRDGLLSLPERHRPQSLVGGDQVHEVGRAGAGQADDDDRPFDLHVVDLGVARKEVVDAQPGGRITHAIVEEDQSTQVRPVVVRVHLVEPRRRVAPSSRPAPNRRAPRSLRRRS